LSFDKDEIAYYKKLKMKSLIENKEIIAESNEYSIKSFIQVIAEL